MNKQTRKDMLEVGIEAMTRTGFHHDSSNHWAIEAQFSHIVLFSEWYLSIESVLRGHNVYDALGYSKAVSNQAKVMIHSSPFTEGKYEYSPERKGVYVICLYNSKILLPVTINKQREKKRYASTGNRTHDQCSNHWAILAQSSHIIFLLWRICQHEKYFASTRHLWRTWIYRSYF